MNNEIKEILDYLTKFINDKEEITKYGCEISVKQAKPLLDYITNLEQENEKKDKIIEKIRKMLHKRLLDDYDTYTANVVCDFQSDFEEIIRLTGGDEE